MSYTFQEEWMLNMPSLVSCIRVQKWLKNGSIMWIVAIGEEKMNGVNIHEVLIVNGFLDVFPKELLRLSPN